VDADEPLEISYDSCLENARRAVSGDKRPKSRPQLA
jgi:hypothetical protein